MSINVGMINNNAPQAPQLLAADGQTTATWVDANQVQNKEGTKNLGQGISPQTTIVGTVKVGLQPTPDTVVASIATQTSQLKFSSGQRTFSSGPIIINL